MQKRVGGRTSSWWGRSKSAQRVSIRPGVSVLSVLRHLNYSPWFALAEFVDNAIQSFIENKVRLQQLHGQPWKLRVSVEVDPSSPGRIRKPELSAIAASDEENAITVLGGAVVRGVDHTPNWPVARPGGGVDLPNAVEDAFEPLALSGVCKAADILEQERSRSRVTQHAEELRQCARLRVTKT